MLAKNKALNKGDFEHYLEIEKLKSGEITAQMIERINPYTPIPMAKKLKKSPDEKRVQFSKRDNTLTLHETSENESSASSLDDSIIEEYWEDFDIDDKIKEEKRKIKFLNLEDPFLLNIQQMEQ